jgi:hypothetical protein
VCVCVRACVRACVRVVRNTLASVKELAKYAGNMQESGCDGSEGRYDI